MRLSVIMSLIMHLTIVGIIYLALPEGWTPKLDYTPPVPIEILTEAELAAELSVPEMSDQPIIEELVPDEPEPTPTEPEVVEAPESDGPDTSSVASSEAVAPDVKTEPEIAPPPEATEPPEEAVTVETPAEEEPVATKEPEITPPKPAPQDNGELDFSRLGQAASNIGGSEGGAPDKPMPSAIPGFSQKRIGEGSKLTASDEALFKAAMARCWRVNIGAPNPERLKVQVEFYLKKDGSLVGPPKVLNAKQIARSNDPYWKAAEQAAVRAVLDCAPYDLLPVERYDSWQIVELNFDPSEMAGF